MMSGHIKIIQGTLSNDNYDITFASANLVITAKTVTVTPDFGQSKVFGNDDPALTYTLSEAIEVSGALGRAAGEDAGLYAITIGDLAASSGNYVLELAADTVNFEIKKAVIDGVTFADQEVTYDGETHSLEVVGVPAGATVTYIVGEKELTDIPSYSNAGEYPVSVKILLANHETLTPSAKLTIAKRPITIAIDNKSSDRTKNLLELTYQVTSGTIIEGDDLGITLSTNADKDVAGTYSITGTFSNTNYDVTFVEGTYTVNALKYMVTFRIGTTNLKYSPVTEGEIVTPYEAPSKPYHDFAGWYTTKDFTELFNFDTPINSNITLYGRYDLHTYQVIFKNHDETILKKKPLSMVQQLLHQQTLKEMAIPLPAGIKTIHISQKT